MSDNTQPEALRLAEILEGDYCPDWFYEQGVDEVAAELRRQHTRIAELESELEAVGAGGVSGPLIGRASLSANAVEPVAWWIPKAEQFCLADKSGDRPFAKAWEPLYAAPPTAQAEGWRLVPVEPTQKMLFVAMNAFVAASASLGAFNAPDAAYRALLAAAPTHPASSVVVEHG